MFLPPQEIERITRRKQAAAQRRVLAAKGYPFDQDAAGYPLVLWSVVEQRFAQPESSTRRGPNPAALAALMERG